MPPRDSILFAQPLRQVRLKTSAADAMAASASAAAEQAAYERGRHDGEKALSEQLIRQRGELAELQNGVLNSLRQAVHQVTHECEDAMVALALEVASKLVADQPISSEMVEAAVREALANVEQNSHLTVLLNPMDYELLQQANAPVMLTEVGGEQLKFQTSPQVTRGGCMIQTSFGVVDARRETKLEALRQSLAATCH